MCAWCGCDRTCGTWCSGKYLYVYVERGGVSCEWVWSLYGEYMCILWIGCRPSRARVRGLDGMGMDSMRAFDVMHSSTRADACGRRGIDDDGWERETKTR